MGFPNGGEGGVPHLGKIPTFSRFFADVPKPPVSQKLKHVVPSTLCPGRSSSWIRVRLLYISELCAADKVFVCDFVLFLCFCLVFAYLQNPQRRRWATPSLVLRDPQSRNRLHLPLTRSSVSAKGNEIINVFTVTNVQHGGTIGATKLKTSPKVPQARLGQLWKVESSGASRDSRTPEQSACEESCRCWK